MSTNQVCAPLGRITMMYFNILGGVGSAGYSGCSTPAQPLCKGAGIFSWVRSRDLNSRRPRDPAERSEVVEQPLRRGSIVIIKTVSECF